MADPVAEAGVEVAEAGEDVARADTHHPNPTQAPVDAIKHPSAASAGTAEAKATSAVNVKLLL